MLSDGPHGRKPFDALAFIEAVCLAALAEVARQRGEGPQQSGSARRGRRQSMRVVMPSEVDERAAKVAVAELTRNGVRVAGHG